MTYLEELELAIKDYCLIVGQKNDRIKELENAIKLHRSQKFDDLCILDDNELYKVLHDGIFRDYRVGNQCEMLKNCERFIKNRTVDGGPWKTYAELEQENKNLREQLADVRFEKNTRD